MKAMRHSWLTYLLIGGLALMLVALGVLQYHALVVASAADAEKLHGRAQEETEHFAADFNREIQNAYFNFQTEADVWKSKNWRPFNERYLYWRDKTAYPDLISDFYFFEDKSGASPLRYDRDKGEFVPVDPNAELDEIRSQAASGQEFKHYVSGRSTLLLPIHDMGPELGKVVLRRTVVEPTGAGVEMPKRYGVLAIKLNGSAIKEQVLPALAEKYFGDGEFSASVIDENGQAAFRVLRNGEPDATAKLLSLSPNNYIEFRNKELLDSIGTARRSNVIVDSRVENHTFNHAGSPDSKTQTFKIEMRDGDKRPLVMARTTTDQDGPWTLAVQHTSGSIDGYIAATLRRNLAIGFGILFLVGAAVGAIIISAMRAKALARRQLEFVSSVSHEFRTPLAVIYSAGENLADGVTTDSKQIASYGDLIKGEGQKLSDMVEQILGFAGARSGRQKYNLRPLSAAEAISDALEQCKPLIDERGTSLELDISDRLPEINGDKRALSQAIQNLVANSIKYSNGSSWLRVAATNGDGKVRITVEDRGIGIAKGELRQIFEPFYRAKEVVDAQIHGNGLGLSLVKQIAEAHGGRVFAESEVNAGSKLTIELPQA